MRIPYFLSIAAFVVRQTSAFSPSPTRLAFRSPHTSGKAVPPILPNEVFTSVSKGLSSTYDDIPVNNRHAASDWLYNVRSFPQSKVLREIRNPLFCVAGWSFAVSLIQRIFSTSCSAPLRILGESICIPTAAHSFLVSSLGLLLVFRTNSAYQRFYEGRKIWENILSVSRNFSRITRLYAKEVGMDRKVRMMNLVAAYPYLLRHHIRHGCLCEEAGERIPEEHRLLLEDPLKTLETRFEGDKIDGLTRSNASPSLPRDKCYVDKRKLPWNLFDYFSTQRLARTQNRPLWACDRIGREIMAIPYGPNFSSRERLVMLTAVDKLTNAIGECERIHQTAVPLNYARHSLRSLTLFLFTLPFALVKDMGFLTAPVTAGIAWLMFGVYQIGYSIEDPFQGSLRLSNLCDAIRKDVVGSIAEDMEDSYSSNQLGLWDEGVDEVTLAERAEDFLKTPMIIPTLLDQGISNLTSSASVDASKPPS